MDAPGTPPAFCGLGFRPSRRGLKSVSSRAKNRTLLQEELPGSQLWEGVVEGMRRLPPLLLSALPQKSRHTESEKLQVQIQAYLDNVFDVGGLLEDAETKNVALEKVEELEEHVSHVCGPLLLPGLLLRVGREWGHVSPRNPKPTEPLGSLRTQQGPPARDLAEARGHPWWSEHATSALWTGCEVALGSRVGCSLSPSTVSRGLRSQARRSP